MRWILCHYMMDKHIQISQTYFDFVLSLLELKSKLLVVLQQGELCF